MGNKSNPVTRSGKMILGKGSPTAMWLDGVAAETITKNQIVYIDSHPVTGTAIASTDSGANIRRKVGVATNATRKKALGSLYIALNDATTGTTVKMCEMGILNTPSTASATAGDPVYLSTAGVGTLTAPTSGFLRIIGEVTGVGASGTGLWNFNPSGISQTGALADGFGFSDPSASTAITGATETLTAFDNAHTIPANFLRVGTKVRVHATGLITAETGNETHTLSVMVGGAAVAASGDINPTAANDVWVVDFEFDVRSIGATGTIVGVGLIASGAGATASPALHLIRTGTTSTSTTTIDTTAALAVTIGLDRQATATDSDSMRMDTLSVEVIHLPSA